MSKTEAPERELTYEDAREQLIEVVRQLESGDVPISTAMELWERGERLVTRCQAWLDGAKATIESAQSPPV
ncbi:MAG: exodeoxyribonuclease VII small subunit [Propioniciclava sp.]